MSIIVVFDDVASEAAALASTVMKHPQAKSCNILTATSASQLEDLADQGIKADIFLTDIVTEEDQPSGIDIVKRTGDSSILKPSTQVIYASGHLETALDVYETPHVYFLLKPIKQAKLDDALNKAFSNLAKESSDVLTIHANHRSYYIDIASISYVESHLRKVIIHSDQGKFESYMKLDDVQAKLPATFLRCHRSYLVNANRVLSLKDNEITLVDQTRIPISQQRAKETRRALLQHIKIKR